MDENMKPPVSIGDIIKTSYGTGPYIVIVLPDLAPVRHIGILSMAVTIIYPRLIIISPVKKITGNIT